ncbi:metalloregulator ArsR/SmtB family transcription factor [Agarivorans sp. B2Z047]|uniref:Arsenical resistance operon repressor n=1 Tax=Agarivorans albus MKT 106 TaxID=1331007 RepID=R9PH62_AGAAL|nr:MULTISPECIES: metalloregulator ArsR/SmtB family transcription factor [Agarivorans]MPW28112.1 metalloregulator ArsR/SmtB family transcription factor [Agarivorans sp. B2Z047]UQN44056.1 metalloregulator ArsR/SmtB family transcription factor [Agarivorans sp. B2Z047]GAD00729.1 arsenical resistance operon repressor [Agarivorans albus MKT 106]
MNPQLFYKCLADDVRLKALMIIAEAGEACVCDLMQALQLDQPKTSRHLAQLRKCQVLLDQRRGKWVYYQLHPELPSWAERVLRETQANNKDYYQAELARFEANKQQLC